VSGFWRRFAASVDRWPERPAIVVQGKETVTRIDYRLLHARAEAMAERLASAGVRAGQRCALLGENGPDWITACLGVLRLGAVAVPLDRTYAPAQVAILLADSEAVCIVCSAAYRGVAEAALEGGSAPVTLLAMEQADPAAGAAALPDCPERAEEAALLLYTSGTTADPKGVVVTHGNILAAVDGIAAVLPLGERDSNLGALPLFHILAQVSAIYLPLSLGACVVLLEEVSGGEVLRAMREQRITILCSVPQFFYLIHERIAQEIGRASRPKRALAGALVALSGFARDRFGVNLGRRLFRRVHDMCGPDIRFFVSAGAAFDPAIARQLYRFGFDIIQAYGLTETTGAATVTPPGDNRLGTVGRPIPGVSVAVRGADGAACAAGQEGEVVIAGPTVTPGYHRRPDATAEAFDGDWFRTGDLGVMDEAGHLRITGRSKDIIVLGSGKKIYPEEIERHLERSPFVKEVCVVGRRPPGRALGEIVHAVVVPDMDVLRRHQVVNVRQYLRNEVETLSAQLPAHQRVMGFDLSMQDLPRTTTRKIKRFVVLKNLDAAGDPAEGAAARTWSDADRDWATQPGVAPLLEVLRSRAPAPHPEIHPEDSLELDLGFDSLARIELLVAAEQAAGTRVGDDAKARIYTVRDFVDALRSSGSASSSASAESLAWPILLDRDDASQVRLPVGAGPGVNAARRAVLALIRLAARALAGVTVRGAEHLPANGPFILAVNHQSYLDTFLLLSVLPYPTVRRMLLLGKTKFFEGRLVGWFATRLNITPVDADANLVQAMRVSAAVLRGGRPLLLFPEGERSIDGEIKPLRRGAAILACHLDMPIVPVVLDGPYAMWPRGRSFQRLAPVAVRILPPIPPPAADAGPVSLPFDMRTEAMTRTLHDRMEATLRDLRTGAPR